MFIRCETRIQRSIVQSRANFSKIFQLICDNINSHFINLSVFPYNYLLYSRRFVIFEFFLTKDRNCCCREEGHQCFWRDRGCSQEKGRPLKFYYKGPRVYVPILLHGMEKASRQSTRFLSFCTPALIDRSKDDDGC